MIWRYSIIRVGDYWPRSDMDHYLSLLKNIQLSDNYHKDVINKVKHFISEKEYNELLVDLCVNEQYNYGISTY